MLIPLSAVLVSDGCVGHKAERQWCAFQSGLPVLPGWMVPTHCARPALRAGAAALSRSRPAGRATVLRTPVDTELAGLLVAVAYELGGGPLIVRSSALLDADPRWSGAFSSVIGVGPAQIVTAVRSVWASAFAEDPLERMEACDVSPGEVEMAVLIQPEIRPDSGGVARVSGEAVVVEGVAGHPGPMFSGWADGASARVSAPCSHGDLAGVIGDLPAVIGGATVLRAAELARATLRAIGDDLIEWAAVGDKIFLLQSGCVAREPAEPAGPVGKLAGSASDEPAPAAQAGFAGRPVVAGTGTGRLLYTRPHEPLPRDAGDVILLIEHPVPAYAPLLFAGRTPAPAGEPMGDIPLPGVTVRGLVARGGPTGSHLAQIARALAVPMVVGCPLELTACGQLATIDGSHGQVFVTDYKR